MNNSARQNYRGNRYRKILEEIIDMIVGKDIEMREIIAMIGLIIGIGQETEILQGVMVGTGALIAADPDQDPE